jgi:hypothetical protein
MTFEFKRRRTVKGIARELLRCFEDRERWTVGTYARGRAFEQVDASSPEAVCWCAEGAAFNIVPTFEHRGRFFDAFLTACGRSILVVNDGEDGYNRLCAVLKALAS